MIRLTWRSFDNRWHHRFFLRLTKAMKVMNNLDSTVAWICYTTKSSNNEKLTKYAYKRGEYYDTTNQKSERY